MLGLPSGLIWRNSIQKSTTIFDANTISTELGDTGFFITDCIAWYDFTDQSTIYKDNSGLVTISGDESIGRINNKAASAYKLGSFLRCVHSSTSPGDNGSDHAPTFKLNGVNGFSYAQFDSTAHSGSGQCLVGSDYYKLTSHVTSKGHGGGVGNIGSGSYNNDGYYNTFNSHTSTTGSPAPNNNLFAYGAISNTDLTVFWVVKPSTDNPAGSGKHTHWLIRPDDSDDSGEGRTNETYFEGYTQASGDLFRLKTNAEDQGATGTTYGISPGIDVIDEVCVFMAKFNSGTDGVTLGLNGGVQNYATIISSSSYYMLSGMMALGRWSLGNINSGAVSDSGFDGDFYEILVYKKTLSDDEVSTVLAGLLSNKYS